MLGQRKLMDTGLLDKTVSAFNATASFLSSVQAGLKGRILGLNPNTREYWNRKLARFNGFWRTDHYRLILELLPTQMPFTLLDVGCALGDGCELIQKQLPLAAVTGIDFSVVGIRAARRKNSFVRYRVMDILKDPIGETYDYITIIQTLEHFDDPYPVVEKCLRHTRQSLIVSTPYDQNVDLTIGEHQYRFDEQTFKRYNSRVARITDYSASLGYKCIVYEIRL